MSVNEIAYENSICKMQIQMDLGELNASDTTTVVVIYRYRLNFNKCHLDDCEYCLIDIQAQQIHGENREFWLRESVPSLFDESSSSSTK